jgi:mono/diheme cytochrome c family protein
LETFNTSAILRNLLAGPLMACALAAPALADEAAKKDFDVKSAFRNICGFCHADYGRHASKGPQLMNSERSDEFLFNRIKTGLPGRMAAFGSIYSDEQIHTIVKFIRSLKPGVEPQNP